MGLKDRLTLHGVLAGLALAPSLALAQVAGGAAAAAGATGATTATGTAVAASATSERLKNPCAGGNALSCGMMALAAYQVISSLTSSNGSSASSSALSSGATTESSVSQTPAPLTLSSSSLGTTSGVDSLGTSASLSSLTGELIKNAEATLASAKAAGVAVSADGSSAITRQGVVSARTVGSQAAAQAAGFSASDFAEVQEALKAAQAEAASKMKSLSALMNDVGAGGKVNPRSDVAAGGRGSDGASRSIDESSVRVSSKRKATAVAGLSKKLGNDNIGVAQDNIFEMISRRYKAKEKENAFLKE